MSVECVRTTGLTYGFFITLPHPQRGFEARPSGGALITSISHPHPAFGQTNRWPFHVLMAMTLSRWMLSISGRARNIMPTVSMAEPCRILHSVILPKMGTSPRGREKGQEGPSARNPQKRNERNGQAKPRLVASAKRGIVRPPPK